MAKKRPRANSPAPRATSSLVERQGRSKIVPDPDGNFAFLRQPLPGQEVCDFCSQTPVAWTYPARDIGYSDLPGGGGSKGAWAACRICHDLIEANNMDDLTERAVSYSNMEMMRQTGVTKSQIRTSFKRMHARFSEAREGMAYPHKSTFSTTTDSKTGSVIFSSPEGMEPEAIENFIKEGNIGQTDYRSPLIKHRILPPRPKWANARSFNKTWDSLLNNQPRSTDVMTGHPLMPGMALSNFAFTPFVNAHLCVVDPEIVMCMDDMPLAEMWRFAMRHKAPWDPVYLDFEGYGGIVPEVECADGKAKIYGAVVWSPEEFATGGQGPNLAIAPIGGAEYLKAVPGWSFNEDGLPSRHEVQNALASMPWYEYVVMGIGLFGAITASKPIYVVERDNNETDTDIVHVSRTGLAAFSGNAESEFLDPVHEGAILTVANLDDVGMKRVQRGEWETQTLHHADTIMRMCAKVMQTLFFLENAPVEIGPEQVSRQVRRNAERKGEGIADIVTIRGKQTKSAPREEGAREVEWSHRWLRRGYWRHLSDERYLRNRPDKVTPCDRLGEARCPNGECIKVRIDPVICGPDDKPFVAKSSVLKAGLPQK